VGEFPPFPKQPKANPDPNESHDCLQETHKGLWLAAIALVYIYSDRGI